MRLLVPLLVVNLLASSNFVLAEQNRRLNTRRLNSKRNKRNNQGGGAAGGHSNDLDDAGTAHKGNSNDVDFKPIQIVDENYKKPVRKSLDSGDANNILNNAWNVNARDNQILNNAWQGNQNQPRAPARPRRPLKYGGPVYIGDELDEDDPKNRPRVGARGGVRPHNVPKYNMDPNKNPRQPGNGQGLLRANGGQPNGANNANQNKKKKNLRLGNLGDNRDQPRETPGGDESSDDSERAKMQRLQQDRIKRKEAMEDMEVQGKLLMKTYKQKAEFYDLDPEDIADLENFNGQLQKLYKKFADPNLSELDKGLVIRQINDKAKLLQMARDRLDIGMKSARRRDPKWKERHAHQVQNQEQAEAKYNSWIDTARKYRLKREDMDGLLALVEDYNDKVEVWADDIRMNDQQRKQAKQVYRDAEDAIHNYVENRMKPAVRQRIKEEKAQQGMQLVKQKSVKMAQDITKGVMKDNVDMVGGMINDMMRQQGWGTEGQGDSEDQPEGVVNAVGGINNQLKQQQKQQQQPENGDTAGAGAEGEADDVDVQVNGPATNQKQNNDNQNQDQDKNQDENQDQYDPQVQKQNDARYNEYEQNLQNAIKEAQGGQDAQDVDSGNKFMNGLQNALAAEDMVMGDLVDEIETAGGPNGV